MLGKSLIQAAAAAAPIEGWDISNASFNGITTQFNIGGNPSGIFFKPDGAKMYVIGTNTTVSEYDLSTEWAAGTASFSQSFNFSAKETSGDGIFFKSDGTEFYVSGSSSDSVHQYSMATAWDISSASFTQSFNASSQDVTIRGLCFGSAGTRMYLGGNANSSIYQFNLSTAWDISTASYSKTLNVSTRSNSPANLVLDTTGTKLYIADAVNDHIDYWVLSTAWEIDTATYSALLNVIAQSENPNGVAFNDDGTRVYVTDRTSDNVTEYQLFTAWDITSAEYVYATSNFLFVGLEINGPLRLFFKSDGTKAFISSNLEDAIFEYVLSTPWDVDTASFSQSFDISGTQTDMSGIFFKSDGLKMYTVGSGASAVREFDLSVAWDISTLSYQQSFSVNTQEATANDLFFSSDGTQMYVIGSDSDAVHQYGLTTAWDISTASFDQSFSVSAQEIAPQGLFFRSSGDTMFICGISGDDVNEYSLSVPWDISTATYIQNFSVATQDDTPRTMKFKPDGTKMYVVGGRTDGIISYDL